MSITITRNNNIDRTHSANPGSLSIPNSPVLTRLKKTCEIGALNSTCINASCGTNNQRFENPRRGPASVSFEYLKLVLDRRLKCRAPEGALQQRARFYRP